MPGPFFPVPPRGEAPPLTEDQRRARREDQDTRRATRERRLDARRKILLGGALIAHARQDARIAAYIHHLLDQHIGDKDRQAFEGWEG